MFARRAPFASLPAARLQVALITIGVLAVLLDVNGGAAVAAPRAAGAPKRPALVVLLVVDQMRADYVERFGARWTGGLARLFSRGAYFPRAAYPYLQTVTCTGHATLSTGTFPPAHGVVLNGWWDRGTGRTVACTEDPAVTMVGGSGGAGGESARFLAVPTLADVMREQLWPPPRVVSLSLKARSAIMLGGARADAVLWFSGDAPATSTAYAQSLPAFAQGFSAERVFPAATWSRLLPPSAYWFEDAAAAESPDDPARARFPHAIDAGNWIASPRGDAALLALTAQALTDLELGRRGTTDYLAVSFSALDLVGHRYGPHSHEVQDILLRLDRGLETFFRLLDARIGAGRYIVALSADHGVAAIPETLTGLGVDAGRVAADELRPQFEAAVAAELGPGQHVAAILYTDLYLVPAALARLRDRPGAFVRVAEALARAPGVERVFAAAELERADPAAASGALRAAALGFFPGRSGDFILVPRRNWITVGQGTTHGSSNDYDQRVPIVFYGAGVPALRHAVDATPADVAPTLAAAIGVTLPRADGRVLRLARE